MSCSCVSSFILICLLSRLYHHVAHLIIRLLIVKKNCRENKQQYLANLLKNKLFICVIEKLQSPKLRQCLSVQIVFVKLLLIVQNKTNFCIKFSAEKEPEINNVPFCNVLLSLKSGQFLEEVIFFSFLFLLFLSSEHTLAVRMV